MGGYQKAIKRWNTELNKETGRLEGHKATVKAIAIHPEATLAVSASQDGTLKLWPMDKVEEPRTLQPKLGEIWGMAVSADGRFYFANQMVTNEMQLSNNLHTAARNSRSPLTLIIQADKAVTYEQLVRLTLLARDAGITNALLATLPRLIAAPVKP